MSTNSETPEPVIPTPAEEIPQVKLELTPEMKAALARYIPISTDPIDRHTPTFFKENFPPERWPVFLIRKPNTLDLVRIMEVAQVEERKAAEAAKGKPNAPAAPAAIDLVKLAKEALRTWRTRVVGWENHFAGNGEPIVFRLAKDGVLADEVLGLIEYQLLLDIHYRYDALFDLSQAEALGLG